MFYVYSHFPLRNRFVGTLRGIRAALADSPQARDALAGALDLPPEGPAPAFLEFELAGAVTEDRDGRPGLASPPRDCGLSSGARGGCGMTVFYSRWVGGGTGLADAESARADRAADADYTGGVV